LTEQRFLSILRLPSWHGHAAMADLDDGHCFAASSVTEQQKETEHPSTNGKRHAGARAHRPEDQ
jgi:hypothetical protein